MQQPLSKCQLSPEKKGEDEKNTPDNTALALLGRKENRGTF